MGVDNALNGRVGALFKSVCNSVEFCIRVGIKSLANRAVAASTATDPSNFDSIVLACVDTRGRGKGRNSRSGSEKPGRLDERTTRNATHVNLLDSKR